MIELERRPKKRHTKQTLRTEAEKVIKSLVYTLAIMIVVLLVSHIYLSSNATQQGNTLQQQEAQNQDLKSRNANLKTKIINNQSTSSIEENIQNIDMAEIEEKTYVTEEDNAVY